MSGQIASQAVRGMKDKGRTPTKFYADLDAEFHFDFDPCPVNPTFDGLKIDWGLTNFSNPPYSTKTAWILKAIDEQKKGKLTVMLLPVDTSTSWFLDLILPNAEVRWVRGRLKLDNGKHPAYASMLAIFKPQAITPSLAKVQAKTIGKPGSRALEERRLRFKAIFDSPTAASEGQEERAAFKFLIKENQWQYAGLIENFYSSIDGLVVLYKLTLIILDPRLA